MSLKCMDTFSGASKQERSSEGCRSTAAAVAAAAGCQRQPANTDTSFLGFADMEFSVVIVAAALTTPPAVASVPAAVAAAVAAGAAGIISTPTAASSAAQA